MIAGMSGMVYKHSDLYVSPFSMRPRQGLNVIRMSEDHLCCHDNTHKDP